MVNLFQQSFTRKFLCIISGATLLCVFVLLWIYKTNVLMTSHSASKFLEFGFVPRTWDIGPIEPVFMTFESSLQYGNWSASLGEEGGIIRLGKDKERYSISMFHQLRCLDIIGNDIIVANATDSKLGAAVPGQMTQHCMNYLRQMVLCRADLRLESARNPYGPRIAVSDVTHTCRDWNAVYRAAEKNR